MAYTLVERPEITSLKAHWKYQVAPGCTVAGKIDFPSGFIFTSPSSIGTSDANLIDMIRSGHVLICASAKDEEGHDADTVAGELPGTDVSTITAQGKGSLQSGKDHVDVGKVKVLANGGASAQVAATPPPAPFIAPKGQAVMEKSKFNLDPASLKGQSLENLNAMILERDPKAMPAGSVEDAIGRLSYDYIPA